MKRAQRKAEQLRRKLGLSGRVDAEAVADILGLEVVPWPMEVQQEMQMGRFIGVAERLDARWRRWVIAHAIGHRLLHSGNHLWIRDHTSLGGLYEREAEDFARALLMDVDEAMEEGLSELWEVAEHFGVPEGSGRSSSAHEDGVSSFSDVDAASGPMRLDRKDKQEGAMLEVRYPNVEVRITEEYPGDTTGRTKSSTASRTPTLPAYWNVCAAP